MKEAVPVVFRGLQADWDGLLAEACHQSLSVIRRSPPIRTVDCAADASPIRMDIIIACFGGVRIRSDVSGVPKTEERTENAGFLSFVERHDFLAKIGADAVFSRGNRCEFDRLIARSGL